MNAFDQMLAADALAIFGNANELAEPVTYTTAAGVSSAPNVVVFRQQPTPDGATERGKQPSMEVYVPVASVPAIDTGGDTITLAWRLGQTPQAYGVFEVIDQDAGMWHVRIH